MKEKFLDENQIKRFVGTGEKNGKGQSLEAFLKEYDPDLYRSPANTVDSVIFTYIEENEILSIHKVLLIKRKNHPSIGWWALPGGFVEYREDLCEAARRELYEETGVQNIEAAQLKSYGDYDRDPRMRVITTAYVGIVKEESLQIKADDDAEDAAWFFIKDTIVKEEAGKETHVLSLTNQEKGIEIQADITVSWDPDSVLAQRKYTLNSSELLSSDHGVILLESYEYISERLEKYQRNRF